MTKFSGSQQSQLAQIGAFLREKREQQGKSLQDIAVSTYIRPQLLTGIETGDPDLLPEPIFVQGFIRRYAETLGLKGIEISQQFIVDSIPSISKVAQNPKPGSSKTEDSATTRLTRIVPNSASSQATPDFASQPTAPSLASLTADEVPIFVAHEDDLETELSDQQTVATADLATVDSDASPSPNPKLANDLSADDPTLFDSTGELDLDSEPSTYDAAEPTSIEIGSVEIGSVDGGLADDGSDSLPVAKTAEVDSESPTEAPIDQLSDERSSELSIESPSPLVSDLPLAKEKPDNRQLTTSPISYTSSQPLNLDASSRDTPNLKPFAIGAAIVAVLTAGIVILANVLGSDRTPTVADSSVPVESVEPTPTESALPELPEPEPASEPAVEPEPPISDAPLFLEVEVTAPAWTTVVADGGERLFEGTLNPGDRVVWEAQNSINVFSGNPGGLMISQNGQPAEPLGAGGVPSGKDYSVQQ